MTTQNTYDLTLDTTPLDDLDRFALLACQRYNFGNTTDWFGSFRGGFYGFNARIYGVLTHNELVHKWIPRLRLPVETDYHAASILFNMDSSIECFAFMLNALGWAASPAGHFRDVTLANSLRKVSPQDITGKRKEGYAIVFPSLQAHWIAYGDLLRTIMEHHDVSKHRETIYSGGMSRQDPPMGFYEALKVQDDSTKKTLLSPSHEICLKADPKEPRANRIPTEYKDRIVLEHILSRFCVFITKSCVLARDDARNCIELRCEEFQNP